MALVQMPKRLHVFLLLLTACELKPPGGGIDVVSTTASSSATGSAPTSSTGGAAASTEIGGPTDATAESTSTTASTTSSSTAEMTFIVESDLPPGSVPCNPLEDMPCPEGQKCSAAAGELQNYIIFVSEPTCLPILGDKQKGEPCDVGELPIDGLDDCADGLCFLPLYGYGDPGDPGVCVDFCGTGYYTDPSQTTCPDPNDFCYQAGCQECGLTLCLPTCDPLAPTCTEGQSCMFVGSGPDQAFACGLTFESLPGAGDACDETYRCTADSWCVSVDELAAPCVDGEACCTPLCDMDAPNTCPGAPMGDVCRPFFPAPFDPDKDPWGVKYNHLGYCALP
jgi:hypothetical protein